MLIRPLRQDQMQTKLGSPYCSDPNCESCKQLREAQEELKRNSKATTIRDDARKA